MDKEHPIYQRLKSLKSDLDGLVALETQCYGYPDLTEEFYPTKVQIITELAKIVLANKWDSDNTEGVITSQEAIQRLEHFNIIMTTLQESLDNTTNPNLKEHFKKGIKNCIADMQSTLTTWRKAEYRDPKDKLQDLVVVTELPQLIIKQPSQEPQQTQLQENSQEQTKEIIAKEQQRASVLTTKKSEVTAIKDLVSVDKTPTKIPVLAKDLNIANRGQIVIHNNFYKVNLGTLGELENNLFFSLCNRLKDKKDTIIRFSPQELKALAGNPHMDNKSLYKLTIDLFNNIAGANFDLIKMLDDEKVQRSKVMFFRKFEVQYDKNKTIEYLDIQVNDPYFTYLLNDLKANFTSMKLQTFVDLSGKYAKNLFRLLERFKNNTKDGIFEVYKYEYNIDDFCAFMGIPKDFRKDNIDSRVINPAIKQLTQKTPKNPLEPPYKSIKVIKNKAKTRGGRVLGYTFEVTINPAMQELEKMQESSKTPLKRFSKRDIKTLEKAIGSRGSLVVKDKGDKDFTFSDAMIESIQPSPKTKRICVLFRANGFLNPEIIEVIALYRKHIELFQVSGNEYMTLVFENIEELKDKFLNTAHKSSNAKATKASPKTNTPTTSASTSANQNTEIFVLQKPMPAKGGELVADCKNGRLYIFEKVQLIAKIKDAEQDVLALFKILNPTDTDLEIAKRHHRVKKEINFFKRAIPECDAPDYFTYTFKDKSDMDTWWLKNMFV
ncbi:replication initiation protein [Helicobacter baculiformis]|uniref:Replication initiation protein n=1 Tax=Helicobacter baculiformis TaxID=427351 RepID=A0ABV7ZM95_9HELI|nr:replication initiation protein [Helicobacter baculiformis]